MNWILKTFDELSKEELYQLLKLRSEVFIVEQNCPYQDIDDLDQKAHHLYIYNKENTKIVAYSRLFNKGIYYEQAAIGRVLVSEEYRKYGYGHDLMKESKRVIKQLFTTSEIKIGAQLYLKKFYESHGFQQLGDSYIEDGIPHIHMLCE
ncbi:GNAT family N-acetyltransferase [Aureivirga sp. CE67]|uniref:GNAT family N-acetyltransferase n=1 Tax=Aureivirga sp. CE67 TaxID=1788983 RepID=UPI0018CB0659|nr:GNAT family N-acetyltransferase [Aureivirga sp. CE67]